MKFKSDEEIIRLLRSAFQAEREEACEYLYQTFKPRVMRWVSKQNGQINGQDIFQEAITELYLNKTYQPQVNKSLYGYFYKIVKAVWVHEHQQKINISSWNEWISEAESNEIIDSYSMKMYESDTYELQSREIRRVMEKLKPKEQELLERVYIDKKKLVDLVEEFNLLNYNNAKQYLRECREKFKKVFNKK